MNIDLAGVLVVSVEQAVAAPYVSGRLADAGARILKIERPEGDFARGYDSFVHGESAYFVWLNRGKESVRLDLKDATDRERLAGLIGEADIFIQNLAPGVISRLGFDVGELRARYPRLITCSISGYGDDGPLAHLKAYDLLVQAETGLSSVTGNEHGPARVGVSVCDIAAGMTALSSIMQALYARERTGAGRHISLSLFHALSDWMNVPYLQYVYGGLTPPRNGLSHPTIAPYGVYECSDGRAILLSIQNEREWVNLCAKALEQPELATDERFASNNQRVANRPALEAIIQCIFARHDRDALAARLEAAQIAYGRLSDMEDLKNHAQNRTVTVDTPTGPVTMLAPGFLIDDTLPEFGKVPALGEDTERVLAEFGLTEPASAKG
ncbi:CaiB/BaiF CoA-transferase family protein [Aurantimonas sp. C2-6-R+9]|uniref:CaiB/BaiF CoA transferase family protein n=1 Tax=unclassified Aurantimonas TaxID=2638230 RepID=UPI002E16CDC2|nr:MULTISPECIES: CaiB/BaiF CoA-transferase family protein [unclassified Aurantimonas]MEC5290105.1 CaiB/BaiF CoA-transferase family protein [Aurantimonas sp. C2-3-R2]MEC5380218.1 CaiB/BaiF CoA-transferase family protein [Aurantimonas sp. C2-6-R+9]MEC5411169.1 CaiB/BaiF CoA-transferase family protein [Aurantimonas sp. C2-4-R8]